MKATGTPDDGGGDATASSFPGRRAAVFLLVLGLAFVVTASGSWGTITGTVDDPIDVGFPMTMSAVVHLSGWNGYWTILGLSIHNYVAVLAGAVAAGLVALRVAGVLRAPRAVAVVLSGYTALHSGTVVVTLARSSQGTVGDAAVATCALAVLVCALALVLPDPAPVASRPA